MSIEDDAEKYPTLGLEYFATRNLVEEYCRSFEENHSKEIVEKIIKPITNEIYEKVSETIQEFLWSDIEQNLHFQMRTFVEQSVESLLGKKHYSYEKYLSPNNYRAEILRLEIAKIYGEQIHSEMISELEKKIEDLNERLRRAY